MMIVLRYFHKCSISFFSWGYSTFLKRRGIEKRRGIIYQGEKLDPVGDYDLFETDCHGKKTLATFNNKGKKFDQEGKGLT